jgi:hypothetical protein
MGPVNVSVPVPVPGEARNYGTLVVVDGDVDVNGT